MIQVKLKKHIGTGKMFVSAWQFLTKEQAIKTTQIPGSRVIVEEKNVPEGFYKKPTAYFFEDGILRNGFGMNE